MNLWKTLAIGLFLIPVIVKAQTLPTVPIYSYSVPSGGYAPNSNLTNYTDSVTGTWTMQYTDGLNRLTGATASAGPYNSTVLGWSYDPFGNRTAQTVAGSPSIPVPSAWATYDGNNRMTTNQNAVTAGILGYDGAGNMTSDGTNQIAYDAENRVCAVRNNLSGQIAQYMYDAEGHRVAKGHPATTSSGLYCPTGMGDFTADETYVVGQNGEQVSEMDGTGQWKHTNVFAGGQLIATYSQDGLQQALHFNITDPLGTKRVQTTYSGVAELNCLSLPFGDGPPCTGATEHFFTGQERDSESGLDHFTFRSYNSGIGRWTSPDPYSGSYDLTNPQSLNRYSYVLNRPMIYRDPAGLYCEYADDEADGRLDDVDYNSSEGECSHTGGQWYADGWGVADLGGGYFISLGSGNVQGDNTSTPLVPSKPQNTRNPNLPNCYAVEAAVFFGDLNPFSPGYSTVTGLAGEAMNSASASKSVTAAIYAATRINTKGGIGLLQPLKSSTYRGLLADASLLSKAAFALNILTIDAAVVHAGYAAATTPCQVP